MNEEELMIDEGEAPNQGQSPTLGVGLTPFGLIGISITDEDGTKGYVIKSPDEAWRTAGHLMALATMMIEGMYAQAMQEQQMVQNIVKDQKVWTPGG